MDEFLLAFKKYAVFEGRSRRREFWFFTLFCYIVMAVLYVVDMMLGTGVLSTIFGLAVLIPSLAVGARRLHDTGRSGWWLLLYLVPLVGFIVLIVFFVMDSQPGTNEYGPNPKGVGGVATA